MKFNFKKIASIMATTVMLGSTIAFASAAWDPFVKNGVSDAAIVVGSSASVAASDLAAATELGAELDKSVTAAGSSISGEGDRKLISEKGTSAVTLNVSTDAISEVWTTAITEDDLPTLLSDGVYQNDENSEFPYTQKIAIGSDINFSHFADSDYKDKTPSLGFKLPGGSNILTYTLDWSTDPDSDVLSNGDLGDIETTDITILGKSYYVLDADNSTLDLTLLDAAESAVIGEGETKTMVLNGKNYEISLEYVGSTSTRVTVNGVTSNSLSAGGTQKLSDGAYLGIKDIMQDTRTGGISKVELSIGTGKLELLNSAGTVELNDVTVDDLNCSVVRGSPSGSKQKINKILINWKLDDEKFLMPDQDLVMPGFEAVKLTTSGVTIPEEEKTSVTYGSDDYLELKTTIKDGALTLPILYATAGTGNFSGFGKASDERLATSNSSSLYYDAASGVNEGFIVSWANSRDSESYYLEASVSRDSTGDKTNRTTITNKLDSTKKWENLAAGDTATIGNVVLTVSNVNYMSSSSRDVTFNVSTGGSFNTLYTDKGLKIYLPFAVANATVNSNYGSINTTAIGDAVTGHSWNSFYLYATEEDKDGNVAGGPTFYIPLNDNGGKVEAQAPVNDGAELETSSGSKVWESYMRSDLATKLLSNRPGGSAQSDVDIYYHSDRVSPMVYIAAPSVSAGSSNAIKIVKDTDTASLQSKNLIIVGGSCINKAAAMLLTSKEDALCGAAFSAKTNVGAGKYLIQVAANPYNANKIAMLVAGYEADQTKDAVTLVKEGNVSTAVGTTIIGPTLV